METTEGTAGQQTMDIHTASHNQDSSKVPLLPTAEDENAEEGIRQEGRFTVVLPLK